MSALAPAMRAAGMPGPTLRVLATLCFAGFIFISMVGLTPLIDTLPSRGELTGDGDVARQISFSLSALAALAFAFLAARERPRLGAVPLALCALYAWAWLSLGWAEYPLIAARRLALITIIAVTVWAYVQAFNPVRLMSLMRQLLGLLVIVNIFAALALTQGVHQPGELDPALVGNWRGLHNHKNEAGAVAAMAAILWFYHARSSGRLSSWIVVALSVFFLWQSNSKSSIGFLMLALIAGSVHGTVMHLRLPRSLVLTAAAMLLIVGTMAAQRPLEDSWNDPDSLTGRVQIWEVMLAFAADHPLLGAGYGSFWNVGDAPPVIRYAEDWVTTVPTGHSGYLDLLTQLGSVGLALAIFGCIVQPLVRLFDPILAAQRESRSFAALLIFCALHNLTETSFLSADAALWPMMLIILCIQQRQIARLAEVAFPHPRSAAGMPARHESEAHPVAVLSGHRT